MGYGVPAAVAAALLEPDRTVVNLAGDGDFLMNGQELATAIALRRRQGRRSSASSSTTAATARSACTRSASTRAGSAAPTSAIRTSPRSRAPTAGGRERVDTTAEFEPAFARRSLPAGPALIHVKLDADVITSRTTLAAIRRNAEARLKG